MKIDEFMNIFKNCEIINGKITIPSDLHRALEFVKSNYSYNMLKEIIANDKAELGIELIYHLYSSEDEENLFIAITVKDEAASIVDIFPSAQADECEIYDLFGIKFIGNPNLKRLYMPENWEGYPLKKDYVQNDKRLSWNDEECS